MRFGGAGDEGVRRREVLSADTLPLGNQCSGRALRAPGHPKAKRGHFRLRHSLCPAKNIPFPSNNFTLPGPDTREQRASASSQPLLNRNCRLEKPSRKGCVARRPLLKPRRHLDRVFCDLTYRCAVFRTKVCLRAIHPFRRIFSPAVPL